MEKKLKTDKRLSSQETRVSILYCLGYIGKEVADKLGISYNTIIRHTQHIYDKLECKHSTNALVGEFLSRNYSIDIKELGRRIGAAILLIFFCTTFFEQGSIFSRRSERAAERRCEERAKGFGNGNITLKYE